MTTTDTDLTQLVINVGTTAQIEAGISGGTITNDMLSLTTDGGNYLTSSDVTSSYSATGTAPVNGTAVASALGTLSIPTDTSDLTNGAGYITGITSSDVTTALGYTPYNSSNPNGYTSNVGTVTSVNNVSPVSGNVTLSIPTTIGSLTDVTITSATDGQALVYDSANQIWKNGTVSGGGSYSAGTGIDITSNTISVTSPTLTNNTTHGLSILGTTSNTNFTTSIGKYSSAEGLGSIAISDSYGTAVASGVYSTCVGGDSSATGTGSTSFGSHAKATANYAVQLGYGTNSEANSVYMATSTSNNWKMLGSDGLIPSGRIPISTSVSSSSDNTTVVGAKLFYDTCGDIETLINAL